MAETTSFITRFPEGGTYPQSRELAVGTGLSLNDSGGAGTYITTINTTGLLNNFVNISGNGIVVKTDSITLVTRDIVGDDTIDIIDDGINGNITLGVIDFTSNQNIQVQVDGGTIASGRTLNLIPQDGAGATIEDQGNVINITLTANGSGAPMTNPMTSSGDIIVGIADGEPARLGIGTANQALKVNSGGTAIEWANDSGMTNPMTTAGDLILGGSSGTPGRLGIGSNGNILTVTGSSVGWAAPAAAAPVNATYLVTTSNGTLTNEVNLGGLVGGSGYLYGTISDGTSTISSDATVPIAKGGTGAATALEGFTALAGAAALGTDHAILVGTGTAYEDLAAGDNGDILTVSGGAPTWAPTVAITQGGTGQTTAAAAFTALANNSATIGGGTGSAQLIVNDTEGSYVTIAEGSRGAGDYSLYVGGENGTASIYVGRSASQSEPTTTGGVYSCDDNDSPRWTSATTANSGQLIAAVAGAGPTAVGADQSILVGNGNVYEALAVGSEGDVLSIASGNVAWAPPTGGITSVVQQVFTANGTYTPSGGMKYCVVEAVGGGGGGGGAGPVTSGIAAGGGGGGGAYIKAAFSAAAIGASQAVTVGAGGTAGTDSGGNGVAGGSTSLGALLTALGGDGGQGVNGDDLLGAGGAPGAAPSGSGTILNVSGSQGGDAIRTEVGVIMGSGGGTFFGCGSISLAGGASRNGLSGFANSGVGGQGGGAINVGPPDNDATGGTGGSGVLIVTEYI